MNWHRDLKGKIKFKEPLSKHTSFKIGGPAKFFIEPRDINDLKRLLEKVKRYKIPLRLIGAGSNLLISDRGIEGAVIKLSSPDFCQVIFREQIIEAGSGVRLSKLVKLSQKAGYAGLEFLSGIPGSLGGALVMNAGVSEKNKNICLGNLVESVKVMDYNGKVKSLGKDKLKFNYRKSNLAKYIILSAHLKLKKESKEKISQKMKCYLDRRCLTQELSYFSAGCIFKNPLPHAAGKLIESCGLKGRSFRGAQISCRHANFIINKGKARAVDVLKLMDDIQREVMRKFRIELKPEIKIW